MVPTIGWSGIAGWDERPRRIWREPAADAGSGTGTGSGSGTGTGTGSDANDSDANDSGATGVVAGYVKGGRSDNCNLTQIVVRGAGHLVPFDQPSRALEMFARFVSDGW
jgi:hypothetical protein